MKTSLSAIILGLLFSCLTGCTYIQSLFPDKEKDYQYTTEIPLLNWPTELQQNKSPNFADLSAQPGAAGSSQSSADVPSANVNQASPSSGDSQDIRKDTSNNESEQSENISKVDVIKYDDGESRLRLDAPFSKSWRVVNKALSRKSIEVTERNRDVRQVALIYDPEAEKSKDDSIMDELNFIWNGINAHDNHYFLTFEEHDQQTDLIFLNEEKAPLGKDEVGLQLLQTLAESIRADIGADRKQ